MNPTTHTPEKLREEFEKWAYLNYPQRINVSSGTQMHIDLAKERAWEIWQAAHESFERGMGDAGVASSPVDTKSVVSTNRDGLVDKGCAVDDVRRKAFAFDALVAAGHVSIARAAMSLALAENVAPTPAKEG